MIKRYDPYYRRRHQLLIHFCLTASWCLRYSIGMRVRIGPRGCFCFTDRYYVYIYFDPVTKIPFYVGKGSGDRAYCHLKEVANNHKGQQNKPKCAEIKRILSEGHKPIISIVGMGFSEDVAFEIESALIQKLGTRIENTGPLTNILIGEASKSGGDTLSHHPNKAEISRKISETIRTKGISKGQNNPCFGKYGKDHPAYGHTKSAETLRRAVIKCRETRQKRRISFAGSNNGMFGKKHTKRALEKMSEVKKGKYVGQLNPNAKRLVLVAPNGTCHEIFGNRKIFCEEHQLSLNMIGKVCRGEIEEWRGWTLG